MSLVVWLPLNGNLENQGLSNVTVTNNGAIVDNNGKIGKCYSFGSSKRITVSQPANLSTTAASLSCWVNLSAWGSSYDSLVNLSTGTGWNDTRLAFVRNDTANRIGFCVANGSTYNFTVMTSDLPLNTWTHLTGTFDGSTIKIYVNGVLNNSAATTFNALVYGSAVLNLGSWSNANNYPINGKLNDVRFYDHCLSAKEVGELAKGLVLHYRLAGPGQANLLNGNIHLSSAWTQENHTVVDYSDSNFTGLKITATQANGRIYNSVSNLWIANNAKYTVSFWAKSDTVGTTIDCSRSLRDFSPTFTLDTNWKYYSGIITTTGTATDGTLSIRINQASRVVYIVNIKVENGAIATPFVPPSNSSIYSAMGYNNNIEYDCSGYRRNGTKSRNITWDIDSPRYTTSYKWPAVTSAANQIISPSCTFDGKGITMAVWVKFTGTTAGGGNYHMPLESSTPGYYEMSVDTSGRLRAGIYVNGTRYVENCANPSMYDNKWHHIAITYNGSKICRYVDGKAYVETNVTGAANGLNQAFYIGSYGTNTTYYNNNIWESDARVYTTALSAEDIAELYHSAVIVDNTGKNYAYEYFEA